MKKKLSFGLLLVAAMVVPSAVTFASKPDVFRSFWNRYTLQTKMAQFQGLSFSLAQHTFSSKPDGGIDVLIQSNYFVNAGRSAYQREQTFLKVPSGKGPYTEVAVLNGTGRLSRYSPTTGMKTTIKVEAPVQSFASRFTDPAKSCTAPILGWGDARTPDQKIFGTQEYKGMKVFRFQTSDSKLIKRYVLRAPELMCFEVFSKTDFYKSDGTFESSTILETDLVTMSVPPTLTFEPPAVTETKPSDLDRAKILHFVPDATTEMIEKDLEKSRGRDETYREQKER